MTCGGISPLVRGSFAWCVNVRRHTHSRDSVWTSNGVKYSNTDAFLSSRSPSVNHIFHRNFSSVYTTWRCNIVWGCKLLGGVKWCALRAWEILKYGHLQARTHTLLLHLAWQCIWRYIRQLSWRPSKRHKLYVLNRRYKVFSRVTRRSFWRTQGT